VKLVTGNIIPKQQAREDLGYTPAQQRRMEALDAANSAADPLADIARGLSGGVPQVDPTVTGPAPVPANVG